MKPNLQDYQGMLKSDFDKGNINPNSLVAFPLDRAKDKVYKQRYYVDICPTLACNNKYLLVLSLDFDKPDSKRAFMRFLHLAERFVLQGFSKDVYNHVPSDTCAVKAAGCPYPVPLIIAALHGIIAKMSDFDLREWPQEVVLLGN